MKEQGKGRRKLKRIRKGGKRLRERERKGYRRRRKIVLRLQEA